LLVDGDPLRFNHDLVRQVAYDAISPWRRRILHRRAAEALDAMLTPRGEPAWAAMASHYEQAGDAVDATRCLEQAALAARRLHAHQEAIGYLERALALGQNMPVQVEMEARLHELRGDSLMARGQHETAETAFSAALERRHAEQRLARAVLQRKVADSLRARMVTAQAEAAGIQALETLGAPAPDWPAAWQHAWLDIQLSLMSILYLRGDDHGLAGLTEAIKPMLASSGTAAHRIDHLRSLAELAVRREHFTLSPTAVESFVTLLAAAQETDDLARIAWAQFGLGFGLLWSDRAAEAAAPLLAGLKLAEACGLAHTEALCLTYLACLYRFLGDAAQARLYAEHSLAATQQVDMPIYRAVAHANLAALHWRAGQVGAAQAAAEQALALWGDYAYPFRWLAHWVLLAVHTGRGELAEAQAQVQAILQPSQRRQPGELPETLAAAARAWQAGDQDAAHPAWQQSLARARAGGYL
jgi:predicted ATPase